MTTRSLPALTSGADQLDDRDMQILTLLADGHTRTEIAQLLYISIGHLAGVMERIYATLGARNAAHAVALAFIPREVA